MLYKYCRECSNYNESSDVCLYVERGFNLNPIGDNECRKFDYKDNYPNNDDLLCPYCGNFYNDYWELPNNDDESGGIIECNHCGKEFKYITTLSRTYSTMAIAKKFR